MQNISKQEILNYINKKFEREIKPALSSLKLKDKDKFNLSERDFIILDARIKRKMKFREIVDLLSEQYKYKNLNEDMIKKAYKRAKDKIDKL
jgi:hypothetical protein